MSSSTSYSAFVALGGGGVTVVDMDAIDFCLYKAGSWKCHCFLNGLSFARPYRRISRCTFHSHSTKVISIITSDSFSTLKWVARAGQLHFALQLNFLLYVGHLSPHALCRSSTPSFPLHNMNRGFPVKSLMGWPSSHTSSFLICRVG